MRPEIAGARVKIGTTAFLSAADSFENRIKLWINPEIIWEGNAQELQAEWELMPDGTALTF